MHAIDSLATAWALRMAFEASEMEQEGLPASGEGKRRAEVRVALQLVVVELGE